MRRTADPHWDLGVGFGPVRSPAAGLDLPWETGPYAFLSHRSQTPLTQRFEELLALPAPVSLPPPVPAASSGTDTGAGTQVAPPPVRPSHFDVTAGSEQEKRQAALSRWNYVLRTFPACFAPSAVLQAVTGCTQSDLSTLELLFAKKSTNTLNGRCSAIKQFCTWWRKRFPHESLNEGLVFLYVKDIKENQGSVSGPDSLLGALAFVHGTLGLPVTLDHLRSVRVTGLSHQALRKRRPPTQALTLSLQEVRWLELRACGDPAEYATLIAGALTFMLCARARRSDLDRSEELQQDWHVSGQSGFLECAVLNPKQAKASARSNRLLPLVAPTQGVTKDCWATGWLASRTAWNLRCSGSLEDSPLLPALAANGKLLRCNLTTSETTRWLRSILSQDPQADAERVLRIKSHSLKATLLSWCAKASLSLQDRTLLGYHSLGLNRSALTYSRDALSGPLRSL